MTTMLRSLIRTSSTFNKQEPNDPASLAPPTPASPTSTLTSSPSFNDFSLHVAQEADVAELPSSVSMPNHFRGHSLDLPTNPSLMRDSMDSVASQPRSSLDMFARTPSMLANLFTARSAAINIPSSASPTAHPTTTITAESPPAPGSAAGSAAAPDTPRRRQAGKINGLDYYEWCELVRSSSL